MHVLCLYDSCGVCSHIFGPSLPRICYGVNSLKHANLSILVEQNRIAHQIIAYLSMWNPYQIIRIVFFLLHMQYDLLAG